MRRLSSVTSILTLSLVLSACAHQSSPAPLAPDTAQDTAQKASTFFQDEAHKIREGLYLAGQPNEIDIAAFKDKGIKHVVNFRRPSEMEKLGFDEPELLRQNGISYTPIPIGGDEFPYTPDAVSYLAEVMNEADGDVLLHCGSGYRASVAAVAWLVNYQNMPLDEALTHAQGWWPLKLEDALGTKLTLEME